MIWVLVNGTLYVARDNQNQIWFSDPMALMRADMRRNFKQYPSRVLLLSAVEDGIYVSDLERIYFMGGGDPSEAVLIHKADYPAIPNKAQKIDAPRIGGSGSPDPQSYGRPEWGFAWGDREAVQEFNERALPAAGTTFFLGFNPPQREWILSICLHDCRLKIFHLAPT
jgi:hypothetical protein